MDVACLVLPLFASLFQRKPPPRSAARAGEETLSALILPRLETSKRDLEAEASASGWIGVSRARSSEIEEVEAPQGWDTCTIGIIWRFTIEGLQHLDLSKRTAEGIANLSSNY